eukprot:10243058-Prorocentrum_lima.AAC.1
MHARCHSSWSLRSRGRGRGRGTVGGIACAVEGSSYLDLQNSFWDAFLGRLSVPKAPVTH